MKRNKVALCLARGNDFGGAERRLLRVFNSLITNNNINPVVLFLKIGMAPAGEKNINGFFGNKENTFFFTSQCAMAFHLLFGKYKWICLIDSSYRSLLLMLIAKMAGTKVLFCSVSSGSSNLLFRTNRQRKVFRHIITAADYIDCLYPNGTAVLRKAFPKKFISQTPNSFTDINKFFPGEKKNIIVFASRLVKGKNVDLFLQSLQKCKNILIAKGYSCYVCGDGDLKDELITLAHELGIEDICQFTGFVNLQQIFSETKIFLSLQDITNYPSQSLIEATACGCYSIITNCGESYLMAGEGFTSLVAPNLDSVANAINECVIKSDEEWQSIVKKARAFAETHYTIDKSTEYFSSIFKS